MNSRSSVNHYTKLIFGLISYLILVICMVFNPLLQDKDYDKDYDNPTFDTGRAEGISIQLRQPLLELDFDFNMSDFKLLYLHTGKTGGTSLNKILRSNCDYHSNQEKKNRCYEELCCTEDELLLSKVTSRTLHRFIPRGKELKKNYQNHQLLWTLRNPIDRIVSALDMRANNVYATTVSFWADVFFRQCGFQTVQDLADALEFVDDNGNHSKAFPKVIRIPKDGKVNATELMDFDCHKFGKATLEGNMRHGDKGHAIMNYAYYSRVTKMLPNKTTFVLRTEFLWDDMIQTNELLVQAAASQQNHQHSHPGTIIETKNTWITDVKNISSHRFTHGSESWEIKSKMTQRGKEIICCYLSRDNQIYENLLLRAVNLSDQQKKQSLESLYRDCGIQSQETTTVARNDGFDWKEWRSNGCPTQPIATL